MCVGAALCAAWMTSADQDRSDVFRCLGVSHVLGHRLSYEDNKVVLRTVFLRVEGGRALSLPCFCEKAFESNRWSCLVNPEGIALLRC